MASPTLLMRSEMCCRSPEGEKILQLLCAASVGPPQQGVPLAASRRLVVMLRGTCSKARLGSAQMHVGLGVSARQALPARPCAAARRHRRSGPAICRLEAPLECSAVRVLLAAWCRAQRYVLM